MMSMKATVFPDPSRGGRTRQSEKASCDVNLIVAHHRRGGVTAHLQQRVAEYGFVPASTFQDCMNEVRRATELFEELPAATREFFQNDPGRFATYVAKPEDKAKLVELGLIVERPGAEPKATVTPASGSGGNPQ